MRDDVFQLSNTAFRGQLRLNKQEGEVSNAYRAISPSDIQKLYERAFFQWERCPYMLQVKFMFLIDCFLMFLIVSSHDQDILLRDCSKKCGLNCFCTWVGEETKG